MQYIIMVISMALILIGCGLGDNDSSSSSSSSYSIDESGETNSSNSSSSYNENSEPEPSEPKLTEQVEEASSLSEAISLVKPLMRDIGPSDTDLAGVVLVYKAQDKLTWEALEKMPDSKRKMIMKDPEQYRGKKLCSRGRIVEIHADHSISPTVYNGGLITAARGVVRFYAAHSTGELVSGSPARICGIVSGLNSYSNSGGGTTHAVQITGVFDLPENKNK